MADIFRFKQFHVDQSGCAMKINTDGVLLGAMADVSHPKRILDIGTGTGVIALMLAQRFPMTPVHAIEIDAMAAETAKHNFANSPFADRITGYHCSLSEFEPMITYDLIVSNPPYFLYSLKNPDKRKSMARHTDWMFFDMLLQKSMEWLSASGSLQLVLPMSLMDEVRQKAVNKFGFVVQWEVNIYSFEGERPIRGIMSIGFEEELMDKRDFIIYESKGEYSRSYKESLKEFFLAF